MESGFAQALSVWGRGSLVGWLEFFFPVIFHRKILMSDRSGSKSHGKWQKLHIQMVSTLQFGTNLWPVGTDSVHLKWARLLINQKCTLVPNCLDRDVSRNSFWRLLKDFTAFAQVVLPDPPAGHHNLALHFFDHDGREAERTLFHHIPLFHSYGALPSLLNKGSCDAVIQSWKAGARIVTVSEEDQSIVVC